MIERYTRERMKTLWSDENRFRRYLDVEVYACEARAELGLVPKEAVKVIREKADFTVERINAIEATTHHDLIAFVSAVSEKVGPESRYIHMGLTSTDVVDTALSALTVQALDVIIEDIEALREALAKLAREHKKTIMMGRTHGVHAEPTTFGLKAALWYDEMGRNRDRVKEARTAIAVGKLSGAVGTFSQNPPEVEAYVCRKMGLKPAPLATQTLQRDRHAQVLTTLAVLGGSIEKIATEIRSLQKTETREAEEPFRKGQKGSSAMPHKRNPVMCEQLTGLARVLRGYASAALEDQALWHERDISHSSVERIILPDATTLADYMLDKLTFIIGNLHVYPKNMLRNINATHGLVFSSKMLTLLVSKGVVRDEAYPVIQKSAMKTWEDGSDFLQNLLADKDFSSKVTPDEVKTTADLNTYLEHLETLFERAGL